MHIDGPRNKGGRRPAMLISLAALAAAVSSPGGLSLSLAGVGAAGLMLSPPALAQGAGSGKEGEGQHQEGGQGGGGLGASGSGPQGSGAQGDSHAPPGTPPASSAGGKPGDDNDAVTNKDVQRLYTPPPQDRAAPANAEKPAR
ncbi:hypothetical protein CAL29_15005 [Bordetella genomosp. 10]|uniref:Uncharacterized protein n=2 Tax=Bordetella genomosp. 10 TaxID=1416804 RepID=A0A261SBP1_9BORD|nr:hypothetical protein CAL29_15005 [Bordetella genomosp. 10]